MKIGELFFKIGANSDDFEKSVKKANYQTEVFAAKVVASLYAIDRLVSAATGGATRITNMSNAIGVGTTELQKFAYAANQLNTELSFDEASQNIAKLSNDLYDLQHFGTGNAGIFKQLSFMGHPVDPGGKDTIQTIKAIRDAMKGLDNQAATSVLRAGGLSAGLLPLFRASDEEIDKFGSKFVQSPEQLAAGVRAGKNVNTFKTRVTNAAEQAVNSTFDTDNPNHPLNPKYRDGGGMDDVQAEISRQRKYFPNEPLSTDTNVDYMGNKPIENLDDVIMDRLKKQVPDNYRDPKYVVNGNYESFTKGMSGGTNSIVQNNTINVNGDNPQATANAVDSTLKRNLKQGLADQGNGQVQ